MDATLSLDATAQMQALGAGRIGAAELLELTRRRYETVNGPVACPQGAFFAIDVATGIINGSILSVTGFPNGADCR